MQLPLAVAALLAVLAHVALGVTTIDASDKAHVAVGGESVHSSDNGHGAAGGEKVNPSDKHDNKALPKGVAVPIRDHPDGYKEVLLIHPQKNGEKALQDKGMTFVRGSGKTILTKDGKMVDETSAQTAMRELEEETGYKGTHDRSGKVVQVLVKEKDKDGKVKENGKVKEANAHVIHVPPGSPKGNAITQDTHKYEWVHQKDVLGHLKQDHLKEIVKGYPEVFPQQAIEKVGDGPNPTSSRHEPAEAHQHAMTHPRAPARHPHAPVTHA